uniref:Uncharacterized protein n=1 Tax=Panagrolaimus sp. ES5 TaxID=591445 RepID=A0AC34GB26_9BILA
MIGLVESPSESLKSHCIVTGSSDFVDDKLESFYQPGIVRVLLRIEIAIFCCTISAMFIQIERMIRQMPIVQKEFSAKERAKLPYPINAIDEANKMDSEGFKNTAALDTHSGLEDDETQASTHASEKKNDGKNQKSKKHRSKK